ncbi:MAG: nucleotidyltransferase family protein [Roseitalea sp.]|jgi:MurNAc alpha-1-phosphate uridylyltransferase|nr:nucleotidyltransferase family protein [Roseitalea sp.]MBO6721881.1 nucleotidyltransferase family protein [Roseitalea sp.]MBO6743052.1 nucleotidyltransferase family protein [Roseitalea sp.]
MTARVSTAMVLAAGFGKRLRPITDTVPKPLVPVGGRTMLDRALDAAEAAGIERAVVNVHYLGEQIIAHCANRSTPATAISDERDAILETGGGVVRALPLLGEAPFALLNADTFWVDGGGPTLAAMTKAFDPERMDMLLLTAHLAHTTGHSGGIDFALDADNRIARAPDKTGSGVIYAGAAVIDPAIFAGAHAEPHSLNRYFDRAIAAGRLFGHTLENGHWYTVGTPDGLAAVEAHLATGGI